MSNLYHSIFNTTQSNMVDVDNMHQIAKEHPYAAVAHFFALQHSNFNNDMYKATAAKAALFFSNPFMLQNQLAFANSNNQQTLVEPPSEIFSDQNHPNNDFQNETNTITDFTSTENVEEIVEAVCIPIDDVNKKQTDDVEYPTNSSYTSESQKIESNDELVSQITTEKFIELKKHLQDNDADTPLFEPLHATDYFASQGIKINEEDLSNDKLSVQLKSFTAWLKVMKKVHPDKLPQTTIIVETAIQKQAEKSNIEADVLTEAMADAFLQQGKLQKAREIYQKLSLLNPTKSAYFAAKLQNLN